MNGLTKLEYSQRYYDDWMYQNFSISLPSSTIKELPKPSDSSPTFYLRYKLSLFDVENYSGFLLKYNHLSGVIIRINGKEILRDNLQEGEILETTEGLTSHEYYQEENLILPITYLSEKITIISIEIHKSPNDVDFPYRDRISIIPLDGDDEDDCIDIFNYGSSIQDSSSIDYCENGKNCVNNAFDMNINTYWRDVYGNKEKQSFVDLSFGNLNHFVFNQFYLIADVNKNINYPTEVSISGEISSSDSFDSSTSMLLSTLHESDYYKDKSLNLSVLTFNTNDNIIYTGSRVDILKSNQVNISNQGMEVREIKYRLCRERKCLANNIIGIEPISVNSFTSTNCTRSDIIGSRKFYCSNQGELKEISNTCNESPEFISTETEYLLSAGKYYHQKSLFEVSGVDLKYSYSLQYSTSDDFIPGLEFNSENGLVSGMPYKSGEYVIKFIATNKYGICEKTMRINVISSNRLLIWKYNTTITLNVYENYKSFQIFWVESSLPVKFESKSIYIYYIIIIAK